MSKTKFEIDTSLKVGDLVFFNCSNPAVGIIRYITKKKDKVDIQFFEGASCNTNKTYRHKVSNVSVLNPVLNRHLIDNKIIEDTFKGLENYSYFVFQKPESSNG